MDLITENPRETLVDEVLYAYDRDNDNVLSRTLDFEMIGRRGCGRPKLTWRGQMVKQMEQIELKKEDAINIH